MDLALHLAIDLTINFHKGIDLILIKPTTIKDM